MMMEYSPAARPARLFTLQNGRGMRVTVSEHGAALVSWWAPDRYGRMADVLLGYEDEGGYAENGACLGAVVHRDGGAPRMHAPRWRGELDSGGAGLRLSPADPHAAGLLAEMEVRYGLDEDGSLSIGYHAVADGPALVNFSSHACFNLNGGQADVGDHMLQIDADRFLARGPNGALRDLEVSGTPFDFRRPAPIGPRLHWPHEQIGVAGGFDHAWQVGGAASGIARPVASIHDPGSGRRLQVATTEAGLHFYSGNRLDGVVGRGAAPYARHAGFCLEAGASRIQRDGVLAPGMLLGPGETYRHTTVYRLSLQP